MRRQTLFLAVVSMMLLSSCASTSHNSKNIQMSKKVFYTSDGFRLFTNYYERVDEANKRLVVILPGLFQNKDTTAFREIAPMFTPDFDVLSIDLRGQGESEGRFHFGQKETKDLKEILDFAHSRYAYVGVIGFSIGGAIAVGEETEFHNIHSLIAVSSPSDLAKTEKKFWRPKELFFALSHFEIKKPLRWSWVDLSFSPISKISQIQDTPILFIHGSDDSIVSVKHSEDMYEKAQTVKKLVIIPGGLHSDKLFLSDPKGFRTLCLDWFETTLRPPANIRVGNEVVHPEWKTTIPLTPDQPTQKKQAV